MESYINTDLQQYWDILIKQVGASEEALKLLTNINGYNLETLQDALYFYTGLREFDQLDDEHE